MIDGGTVLNQIMSHLNVIVDDRFQQRGPAVFVLRIHLSTGLSAYNRNIKKNKPPITAFIDFYRSCTNDREDRRFLSILFSHLCKNVADFQQTSLSRSM